MIDTLKSVLAVLGFVALLIACDAIERVHVHYDDMGILCNR